MRKFAYVLMFLAIVAFASNASAAAVSWGSATDIAGPTDVVNGGTYSQFVDSATTQGTDLTVNGVTFNHLVDLVSPSANGVNSYDLPFANSNIVVGYDSWPHMVNGPVSPTDYQKLLSYSSYELDTGSHTSGTITFGGLTIDSEYQVQIWSAYWNGEYSFAIDGVTMKIGATPQYILGTFTADAETQVIGFDAGGAGYSFLPTAMQLRAVPEPGTLILLGCGLLGLLCYAWRKR